jgi:hypothetical protein
MMTNDQTLPVRVTATGPGGGAPATWVAQPMSRHALHKEKAAPAGETAEFAVHP